MLKYTAGWVAALSGCRYMNKIKDLNPDERPYEKCVKFGAEHLTDAELIAILLRSGTRGESSLSLANRILHPVFSQEGILCLHPSELVDHKMGK